MTATGVNHVAINAIDLEESVRFYTDLLGLRRIPTYTFAFRTQFLQMGDQQLHIFERSTEAPSFHHVGINVSDFELVFSKAEEMGILDSTAFFSSIYELPDGSVQMYLRDPAGNLIEIDWPDVETLDPELARRIPKLADRVRQEPASVGATLYSSGDRAR